MDPAWLGKDFGLSTDPDLRQLQIRWLRDNIWMRRVVLGFSLICPAVAIVVFIAWPSVPSIAGAGASWLVSAPLAYFFGRGLRKPRDKDDDQGSS
jgi:hypothetical protein